MPRTKSVWFFLFLLVLGGGFLALLIVNRNYQRPPPGVAVWGAPERAVRFVSYHVPHDERGVAGVIEEIRKLRPDVVLLQGVERRDLSGMTEALGTFPAVYHASENLAGARATWGNAMLSTLPLYDVGTIPNPGGGGPLGVWATVVAGGRKFKVASVYLSATPDEELTNLQAAWREAGGPPIVVGGDFNQVPQTKDWANALKALGVEAPKMRNDSFLISKEWRALDGGVVSSASSDHKPIWLSAGK